MEIKQSRNSHRIRYVWLHREGVLSDGELTQRLALIENAAPLESEGADPIQLLRLN